MMCQICGQRDASIHLVELIDGKPRSQWLCPHCAGKSSSGGGGPDQPFGFPVPSDDGKDQEDAYSLASFLGQAFEPLGEAGAADLPACPACGYTLDQFRRTNLLGCPRCYDAFRKPLLAILSHLHRHVSHLGKVPRSDAGSSSRSGALTRTRVALEKAIGAEDFEKAARLRDEIHRLESGAPPEGDDPS